MGSSSVVFFGPFSFDRARMVLRRDDQSVPIGGRGAALLTALVDAGGEVVTRAELLDAAWPNQTVEERNLSVQIAALRKAMGDLPDGQDPIRTVSRVGYRLLLDSPRTPIEQIQSVLPTIAVLPFANSSRDPDLAFFADGVTEDLITALSRFKTFAVIARNSSFAYKDRVADVPEVARALGVRYILEGSVRRSGDRVRVSARLTDAPRQTQIWGEAFEGALGDIFDMQDRITEAVVGLVEPHITQVEIERSRRKRPESLDAYDYFLRGIADLSASPLGHMKPKRRRSSAGRRTRPDLSPSVGLAAGRTRCDAPSAGPHRQCRRLRHEHRPVRTRLAVAGTTPSSWPLSAGSSMP
jgi:TolB-like protein